MRVVGALFPAALLAAVACRSGGPAPPPFEHPFDEAQLARVLALTGLPEPPLDPTNAVAGDPRAARLGQWLFFDSRLSANGRVSCSTCHRPELGWADGEPLAEAIGTLERHTQSLWNVAYNRWFFWDGRADTLWSQAVIPLENELEHGTDRVRLARLATTDAELREAYEAIFGPLPDLSDAQRFPRAARPVPYEPTHPHHVLWEGMAQRDRDAVDRVFTNLAKCIAAFERAIVTRDAPFDRYARALAAGADVRPAEFDAAAERGLALFVGRAGCINCHHGPNFTDLEFHDTRVPAGPGGDPRDPGRYGGIEALRAAEFHGAGAYSDEPSGAASLKLATLPRHSHTFASFKTPSLRNVATTAPYMHHGQLGTLEEVVRFYSTLDGARQAIHPDPLLQPLGLSEDEIGDLVAFLESLTDDSLADELRVRPPSPILR